MSDNLLNAMTMFVNIVETGSFTGAGSRLGLSPSAVSKAMTRLERRFGVRLLYRNTRNLSLTDEGGAFLERSRQILAELEEVETTLTRRRVKPRGRLRIHMPPAFGRRVVMPLLARFAEDNDELTIDVELSDRLPDLTEEGFDVALRSGGLRASSLIARRLCDIRYVSVASPAYLRRFGEPRAPSDLDAHRCLGFYTPYSHRYREWEFASGDTSFSKPLHGRLNVNSAEALMDAAIAGAGIARIATFIAAEAIRDGLLKPVLKSYITPGPTIWLLYAERRFLSLRIKTFADFLSNKISSSPSWDEAVL